VVGLKGLLAYYGLCDFTRWGYGVFFGGWFYVFIGVWGWWGVMGLYGF